MTVEQMDFVMSFSDNDDENYFTDDEDDPEDHTLLAFALSLLGMTRADLLYRYWCYMFELFG